jgi:hypothetical protein
MSKKKVQDVFNLQNKKNFPQILKSLLITVLGFIVTFILLNSFQGSFVNNENIIAVCVIFLITFGFIIGYADKTSNKSKLQKTVPNQNVNKTSDDKRNVDEINKKEEILWKTKDHRINTTLGDQNKHIKKSEVINDTKKIRTNEDFDSHSISVRNNLARQELEKNKKILLKAIQRKIKTNKDFETNNNYKSLPSITKQEKQEENKGFQHSRYIPSSVKKEVWNRDNGQCVNCGSTVELEYDHIIPYSKGGTSKSSQNIQLLCLQCNRGKKDKII